MDAKVVIPVLIAFAISVILGPIIIPFLRRLKMGQTERVDGVQSHLKKAGTPTMGGIIFLLAVVITCLFYLKDYPKIIPILFLTLGFGLIGFLDDYLKVVLKRSDGLLAWQKFLLQILITAVFVFYMLNYTDVSLRLLIPFWSGHYLDIGCSSVVCGGDRDGQRCELYRRSGWAGGQCDHHGCRIFHRGLHWDRQRD